MDIIVNLVTWVTLIVTVASLVAATTKTPKDDELLGKLYKAIELLALNVGKAKMLPPNKE